MSGGLMHHARVLAAIAQRQKTIPQMEADTGFNRKSLAGMMRGLMTLRVVYIASWTPSKHGVPPQPMFRLGEAPHAPAPMAARQPSKSARKWITTTRKPAASLILLASAIHLLKKRPVCRMDLAEGTGMAITSASYLLRALHGHHRLVRIVAWQRSAHGPPVAYYQWGAGADAPRPQRLSSAQTTRAYAARKKALSEGSEFSFRTGAQYMPAIRRRPQTERAAA